MPSRCTVSASLPTTRQSTNAISVGAAALPEAGAAGGATCVAASATNPFATSVANGFVADAATHVAPPAAPASGSAAAPTEIAFVDWRVVGNDALTVQRDGMLVVVLDANQDGIAQISEVLGQHH